MSSMIMISAIGVKLLQRQLRSKTVFSGTIWFLIQPTCRSWLASPVIGQIAPICTTTSSIRHPSTKSNTDTAVTVTPALDIASDVTLKSSTDDTGTNSSVVVNEPMWLVVGDGDLSYSASIAPQLAQQGIQLLASVLEGQHEHQHVYRNSSANHDKILSSSPLHNVLYSLDATRLQDTFVPHATSQQAPILFDRIIFNFPHWRGKANHRYNRELLHNFFASASHVLKRPQGELLVVLRAGQGGATASNLLEWKQTWMAPYYAAEQGLVLRHLEPYVPGYELSAYRGKDRSFPLGSTVPKRYVFTHPEYDNHAIVHPDLQLCCRHELRFMLHQNIDSMMLPASDVDEQLFYGDTILKMAQALTPAGVRVEVPMRHLLRRSETGWSFHALVFLIVYVGENVPMTRHLADSIREQLEEAVITKLGYDLAKKARPASRPFPYRLLENLIEEWSS